MRVYISVDMEGVAGVVHEDQTDPTEPRHAGEYNRMRRLMTSEANAAIEGALEAGATRILVNDSHWLMRNLLAEELHPSAELLSGGPKLRSMVEGVELGFDAALFVGYHAMAGTPARDHRSHVHGHGPRGAAQRAAGGRAGHQRRAGGELRGAGGDGERRPGTRGGGEGAAGRRGRDGGGEARGGALRRPKRLAGRVVPPDPGRRRGGAPRARMRRWPWILRSGSRSSSP